MKLDSYLQKHNLKPSQFAASLGKPASTITRILNGTRLPSFGLMREIADATGGEVTANDFMDSASISSIPSKQSETAA